MSVLFGSKPSVPNLPTVSLPGEQQASIAANQAALPGAEALAASTDSFNQQQLTQMLNTMIPGFSNQSAQLSKNTSAMLSGEIPADVSEAISQSGAARSLGGGYAGSGMGRDLVARDLGVTSLNLMQQGQNSLESWTGEMAKITEPGQFNVQQAFVSPEQMYQATNEQDAQQFQRSMLQNEISAAPDPVASGIFNSSMSFLSSMRGSGGYQAPTNASDSFGSGGIGNEGGNAPNPSWGAGESYPGYSGLGDVGGMSGTAVDMGSVGSSGMGMGAMAGFA